MKTSALYTKGWQFVPHRRRFFTPTVVLLSINKPETVLWTIAKILSYIIVIIILISKREGSYPRRFWQIKRRRRQGQLATFLPAPPRFLDFETCLRLKKKSMVISLHSCPKVLQLQMHTIFNLA